MRIVFFLVSSSNNFLSSSSWAILLLVCKSKRALSTSLYSLSSLSYSFFYWNNRSRSFSKSAWATFAFSCAALFWRFKCSSETSGSSFKWFSYSSLDWAIWLSIYYFLLLRRFSNSISILDRSNSCWCFSRANSDVSLLEASSSLMIDE